MTSEENTSKTQDAINDLRSMALNLDPKELGLTPDTFPHKVFGMLFETGLSDTASYSLITIADGTTSLYFNTGGGIVGAGEHEAVREASIDLLSASQYFYPKTEPVKETPLPKAEWVNFYFLSFDGVYGHSAPVAKLGNNEDELTGLFFAAHDVVTEIRKIEEARSSGS